MKQAATHYLPQPREYVYHPQSELGFLSQLQEQNPCWFILAHPPTAEGIVVSACWVAVQTTCWIPRQVKSSYSSVYLNNSWTSSAWIWIPKSKPAFHEAFLMKSFQTPLFASRREYLCQYLVVLKITFFLVVYSNAVFWGFFDKQKFLLQSCKCH